MTEQVKIGVVGVGHLGRLHVMQLKEVDEAVLVGIYDNSIERSKTIGDEFSVPVFESFETLLDACDAISIVTPTGFHYQYAKQALNAGRHIFMEKPMTETVAQADELLALAKAKQCKIQIGHIERFNPAIMALEPLEINPLFIEAHRMANFNPRGTDVAVVLDLMIHDIDLILSFVKSPVRGLHASGMSVISPTADIANCRIVFENGCVANVTASRISATGMRKMRFFEPNAYISVDFVKGASEIFYLKQGKFDFESETPAMTLGQIEAGAEKREILYTRMNKIEINPLRYELKLFCEAIINDLSPAVSGEDGRRALAVADQIMASINEHTELVKKHWDI